MKLIGGCSEFAVEGPKLGVKQCDRETVMKTVLRSLVFGAVAMAMVPMAANAELSEDTHITRDDHTRLDIDRSTWTEFKRFYDAGYPPASVMLQGASLGMSLDDMVYMAVISNPSRAQEFYDTGVELMPSLPGWVCRSGNVTDRYANYFTADQLGTPASIRKIADEWFNNSRVLAPFPNWKQNQAHVDASVSELSALADASSYWYQPGADRNSPIFVSLYRDTKEIVVGGGTDAIQAARASGKSSVPVVIVYNHSFQRPLSRYGMETSVTDIANEYFNNRIEITPVPEWKDGDYHMKASVSDLKALVNTAENEALKEDKAAIENMISQNGGMVKDPLLLTLLRTGTGKVWIDSPATLEVASNMGVTDVPVTLFYEDIDRQPCGAPSECGAQICAAAKAAGGMVQCDSGSGQ